jgi:hypothetical protein
LILTFSDIMHKISINFTPLKTSGTKFYAKDGSVSGKTYQTK